MTCIGRPGRGLSPSCRRSERPTAATRSQPEKCAKPETKKSQIYFPAILKIKLVLFLFKDTNNLHSEYTPLN